MREDDPTGPGGYADVNGVHLYYERHGNGRPLVLLHGGLGSTGAWGTTLDSLAAGRHVIAVDLQAHGRTADVDRPITTGAVAEDVAALVRHLKLPRADVMGYSFGGNIALGVAIAHPELVRRLVLVSAPLRRSAFYPALAVQQRNMLDPQTAEMMKQSALYETYARIAPRVDDWPRLVRKMGAWITTDWDMSGDFAKLSMPVLVVAADADAFPPEHAVEAFELLGGGKSDAGWAGTDRPASRLAILPGTTHYTVFSDPALIGAVVRFLDAEEPLDASAT